MTVEVFILIQEVLGVLRYLLLLLIEIGCVGALSIHLRQLDFLFASKSVLSL